VFQHCLAIGFGIWSALYDQATQTQARHKVTRPQTILKFQPPSSLDYRTCHGSQSRSRGIFDSVIVYQNLNSDVFPKGP
jgi:hypothetical protein